jgi:putative FmdB family regulatory protein
MPLFEFVCRECGHRFEALVTGARAAVCPACHSAMLEKLVSSFGARTAGSRAASTGTASRFT